MPLRAALERTLTAAWQQRGPLACSLRPLASLYGVLAARQQTRASAAAQRLPVPVIVVGNVVAGGAGKTPVTLALARHLQARGWRPGIVSRGHGRASADCREVHPDSPVAEVGDEPLLLRRKSGLPVFVAPARAQAGRALLAAHPDCTLLLCDDGLQHRALARDVEICVFDGRGIGNGWLLPAGPLRQPWPPAPGQRRPDLALLTEAPPPALPCPAGLPVYQARRQLGAHALAQSDPPTPLHSLRGQPLIAVAGIARPQAFFNMLQAAGLTLAHSFALPDHHAYTRLPQPLARAITRAQAGGQPILCTEKDAPKLWPHAPAALAVPLEMELPPAFPAALDALLPPPPAPPAP